MAYENDGSMRQVESIADLEKDLEYYKVEMEVVQLKKEEAIHYSLKMVLLILVALSITIFVDRVMMKKEALHVLGIAISVFCFAVVGFGAFMLIRRVPMIVSQRNVDTGLLMHPSDLIREYGDIIREKERLLADAREHEEKLQLDAEARLIELQAEVQTAEDTFGRNANLKLGDESGISQDEQNGLTISLEDALSELASIQEEEEYTSE